MSGVKPSAQSEAHVLEPAIGDLRQRYWTHPCLGLQMPRVQAHKHTGTHPHVTFLVHMGGKAHRCTPLGGASTVTNAFGEQAKWLTKGRCSVAGIHEGLQH